MIGGPNTYNKKNIAFHVSGTGEVNTDRQTLMMPEGNHADSVTNRE